MTDGRNPPTRFSVDTHLFRELGELLVGRESTALIELVKNSYDADATEVIVYGEHLGDPRKGIIRVSDNGVGMDPLTFNKGFLRVAARIKTDGARKSLRFGRRFTGAKGVGRLAAHKLARRIDVQATPWSNSGYEAIGVDAHIDWDKIESVETLDDIGHDAISIVERSVRRSDHHGTTLTLTGLRKKWSDSQRTRFLLEVDGLQAPLFLKGVLPKRIATEAGLFDIPTVMDSTTNDPGLSLQLEGDFAVGDSYWPAVLEAASWLLEIDASKHSVRYSVVPTHKTRREKPNAKARTFSEPHPAPMTGPFFHARLLLREGQASNIESARTWSKRVSGVRVYMEGFRVLPYGEESDDWLFLSRDYAARDRNLRSFTDDSPAPAKLAQIDEEGLLHLSNKHFFGGVFLTVNRSGTLEMLVNREGFVPDTSYEQLVRLVRRGIDLLTRVRAAVKADADSSKAGEAARDSNGDDHAAARDRGSLRARFDGSLRHLAEQAIGLRKLATDVPAPIRKPLLVLADEIDEATAASRDLVPANSMVLVLASVGTQLAAFTHEVNGLLRLSTDVEHELLWLRTQELEPKIKRHVAQIASSASDLKRSIERQAAYLIDIVTPDARRRRSRIPVSDAIAAAWKLVATTAEQRGISLKNRVSESIKTPPMFRSELIAVLSNLMTNAVKAAGVDGRILATGGSRVGGSTHIRLENTGVHVDPADGERWFRPFESTTLEVDPVLGQGMGLGLGITRDLLFDVGAKISFVQPRPNYSTALEIVFEGEAT